MDSARLQILEDLARQVATMRRHQAAFFKASREAVRRRLSPAEIQRKAGATKL